MEKAGAGLHVEPVYEAGFLTVTLLDNNRRPFPASQVSIRLGRPSHESEDQTVNLAWINDGRFSAKLQLGRGQWTGMLTATSPGHDQWQRPIRFFVKE
jgi:nitrogen fixation protein FixH